MLRDEGMRKNKEFFEKNLNGWLENVAYRHKHVVIVDQKVEGVYDDFSRALDFAAGRFVLGEFIIQHVIGADEQVGFLRMAL